MAMRPRLSAPGCARAGCGSFGVTETAAVADALSADIPRADGGLSPPLRPGRRDQGQAAATAQPRPGARPEVTGACRPAARPRGTARGGAVIDRRDARRRDRNVDVTRLKIPAPGTCRPALQGPSEPVTTRLNHRTAMIGEPHEHPPLRLGIAGLGTVGTGVVRIVRQKAETARRARRPSDHHLGRLGPDPRQGSRREHRRLRLGGRSRRAGQARGRGRVRGTDGRLDGPAKAATEAAIAHGKDVVTANKAMLAHHGQALASPPKRPGASALRGGRRGGHPGGQGADRGAGRQRHHPRDGRDERHLQLHPDADAGGGPAL